MFGLLPLILSILGALSWVFVKVTCKSKDPHFSLTSNVLVTVFVFIYIFYPQITSISFGLFNCVNYEDGHSYLKRDIAVKCWTSDHMKMALAIGLPFILTWTVIFPVVIYFRIRKGKANLNDEYYLKTYGLFYVGLSDNSFFWEIIIVNLRKLVFIVCGSILSTYNQEYKVSSLV